MKIAVLGSGSWGTALGQVLAENGHEVVLWGREDHIADEINQAHTNSHFLPGINLPTTIVATTDLKAALDQATVLLFVLPTKAIRSVARQVASYLSQSDAQPLLVHATKGLEQGTHLRVSQMIEAEIPRQDYQDLVVLSGPSHAEEVARHDLTTVTAACPNLQAAEKVQALFKNHYFRIYTNTDVVGVEMGAALKNIIALGAGVLAGAGYGDNAKAALVTRGLAEISRMGIKLGADPLTFVGLSGVGDLVVTCTSPHSRNWQAGNLLAKGYSKEAIEEEIQMVVEGIATCQSAYELAKESGIEMPITEALYGLIYEGAQVKEGLLRLMTRDGKQEASLSQAHY
ncbi:NAD(P)H-dependent glycerol-3-phosphate dehydrogenase [uncultured Abiotrophia sp.]|uniref:NAD(P)H-dependent glycerol-3-phosphate dehydrogenase n=1 Tax=uncultured Abiotrophia sp. TaxID=316094 RepID=UPI00288A3602|nr:NAD(P)H-dependent glycerol-3-phosphate dehydrogenase [uncultured Abiotrophia sp.]